MLHAISGQDAGDLSSVPSKLDFDAGASVLGLRVGYFPSWMKENPATDGTAMLGRGFGKRAWSQLKCRSPTGSMTRWT